MTVASTETASERDRVGPYLLMKAIGAGGSARVDLARIDRAYGFQRHVVIKRPLEHLRGDPRAAEGLRLEARLGGRLRHPNLVSVLDAGSHDGYDYLVLEYVPGGALRSLMECDDPARVRDVPLEVALAIVRDVARGLHDAHELADEQGAPLGLVHRDVSPGNVLVGLDGAVKLADFGIAKETRVATLSGSMHGTVTYMAPEQCRGHAFDRRADIFSLGVILHELVTGQRLFWADNDVASLHRVLAGNVPRPRKVKAAIPVALDEITMRALAQDPQRRYPTARSFADALESYAAGAGAVLGSRHIARWVNGVLGVPSHEPVAAAAAVEPAGERSLVELIAAAPVEEEPPPVTFGTSEGPAFDEIDTEPDRGEAPAVQRPATKRSRAVMGIVIGAGLVAGTVTTAFVMTRDNESRATAGAAPALRDSAPSVQLEDTPAPAPTAAQDELESDEPPAGVVETAPSRPSKKRRHHERPASSVEPISSASPSADPAGSAATGSAAVKPPKVEWDPTMILPTDTGSGTKRR